MELLIVARAGHAGSTANFGRWRTPGVYQSPNVLKKVAKVRKWDLIAQLLAYMCTPVLVLRLRPFVESSKRSPRAHATSKACREQKPTGADKEHTARHLTCPTLNVAGQH